MTPTCIFTIEKHFLRVNTIQTGGGGAHTDFGLYNFYYKQAKANLVTLPKIYLGTIWHSKCFSIKFDVPMATTF